MLIYRFSNTARAHWFQNADNLYLEMFVEGGLWLPLLLLLAMIVVMAAIRQLSGVKDSATANAIVAASCYLVAAIAVSQFFDFGALLPANYLTIGLLIGVLVGHVDRRSYRPQPSSPTQHVENRSARSRKSKEDSARSQPGIEKSGRTRQRIRTRTRRRKSHQDPPVVSSVLLPLVPPPIVRFFSLRFVNPVLAVLLLAFLFVLSNDAKTRAETDNWQRTAEQFQRGEATTLLSLDPRLAKLESARLGDVETQLTLAQWRILAHRAATVRASIDRPTVLSPSPIDAWNNSDPRVLRAAFHSSDPADRDRALAALVPKDGLEELRSARKNALFALLANPLDVAARQILIELDFLAPLSNDDTIFQQIKQLRCNYSRTLHTVAKLAYVHPGKETAFSLWRCAFEVNPEFLDMFWLDAASLVDEATFVGAIPEDPYLYVRFAELSKDPQVRALMLTRAEELFHAVTPAPEDFAKHHYSLGRIAELKRDFQAAEKYYAQAVEANSSATDWRYRYVIALEINGKRTAAEEQIDRCLLQDPANSRYEKKQLALRNQ